MLYIEQNIKKKKLQKMVENEINGVVDDDELKNLQILIRIQVIL
jgi:hypothetical protein